MTCRKNLPQQFSTSDKEAFARSLPAFDGFPYLLIRVVAGLFHINLLPKHLSQEQLKGTGIRQILANRLLTCVVLGRDSSLYLYPEGFGTVASDTPRGGRIVLDRLKLADDFPEDDDLRQRRSALAGYAAMRNQGGSGYIYGDLTKGGRPATQDELLRLSGRQQGPVPKGLTRCPECGEWRGECLDPNPNLEGTVVPVSCICENDNRCARCLESLYYRKLNANYFDEADGQVWHVPGFSGLQHRCEEVKP